MPTEVRFHMQKEVLHRYLPQLNPINMSSSGANDRLASVLQVFSTMQATDMQDKADARAAKLLPVTIPKRYGLPLTDRICRITHVVCYSDAPEVYQDLACRVKDNEVRSILNNHFQQTALALRMKGPFAQQSNIGLSKNFDFQGYDITKLSGCLSPFINIPPGAISPEGRERMDEERQAVENYDSMTCMEGVGTVTLADAKEITKGKPFVSSTWVENEI